MDVETLGAAIAVAKSIPDTAAARAEAAAEIAEEYGQRIVFEDNIIVIGTNEGE